MNTGDQVLADTQPPTPPTNAGKRRFLGVGVLIVLILIVVAGLNHLLVRSPVADALKADSRNEGYRLSARFHLFLDPKTLVLDLKEVESAAPIDLLRGLFQAAGALHQADRSFDRVILARSGDDVFHLDGGDFRELGSEFENGQNPVYLMRTLPEKLKTPSGSPAYSTWTGGILGVAGRQMEDVSDAANRWSAGRTPD